MFVVYIYSIESSYIYYKQEGIVSSLTKLLLRMATRQSLQLSVLDGQW